MGIVVIWSVAGEDERFLIVNVFTQICVLGFCSLSLCGLPQFSVVSEHLLDSKAKVLMRGASSVKARLGSSAASTFANDSC